MLNQFQYKQMLIKHLLLGGLAVVIIAGVAFLNNFSIKAGPTGPVPVNLNDVEMYSEVFGQLGEPANSNISSPASTIHNGPFNGNLILFFHPRCPCTNATLQNLANLKERLPKSVQFTAFCFLPVDQPESWQTNDSVGVVRSLGAKIVADCEGLWANRFGVSTSGHVLFYNQHSRLVFDGGVTASRGHEGPCKCTKDLLKAIDGRAGCATWPVFGCPLFSWQG